MINWPPDYVGLYVWRQQQLARLRGSRELSAGARHYYSTRPVDFIISWVDTYDPRNAGVEGKATRMPFVLYPRQQELVHFIVLLLHADAAGLVEKCRDAGITWVCVALSVWLWLFWPGIAIGWGSRKAMLVDHIGVPDSIFEKLRLVIRGLPRVFLPPGFNADKHFAYMRVVNPDGGATIVGEAGDNIGRGGRTRITLLDESAHLEHQEAVAAAIGDNTRVAVDISSVNGPGNVFHRKREAGVVWTGGEVCHDVTNVFIFDWRDHPEKTQAWYDRRRAKAEREGMLHLFAQEVDRNYSAAVYGTLIKHEWIQAAIDAHLVLGFDDEGGWSAALDVADGGLDKSALTLRKGVVLRVCDAWGEGDVGATTRKAVAGVIEHGPLTIQYDCIGVGAGVKSEANRLREEKLIPAQLRFQPWNAGARVLDPDKHVISGDRESPLNKEYYANLKAQAWWQLRGRFYRTYQAVREGVEHPVDTLISIDSRIPLLHELVKELGQVTSKLSAGTMKTLIDKTPVGTRSPNVADSVVMNYWPVITTRYTLENI